MKVVKLTKKDLRKGWGHILTKCGLVDGNNAHPSNLYMSAKDIKEVRRERLKNFKSRSNPRQAMYGEALDFLNLGPCQELADVIKPGYALVDDSLRKKNECQT